MMITASFNGSSVAHGQQTGGGGGRGGGTIKNGRLTFSHIADFGIGGWTDYKEPEITTVEAHIALCQRIQ